MRYDVVLSDLDGCLANEAGGAFDLERLGRLAEHNKLAQQLGDRPPITVCTGRPLPFAEAMCRLLNNEQTPCVAENGVWLYWPATNHYDRDPAITADHLEAVHGAASLLGERYLADGFTQQPGKVASVTLYHPDRNRLHAIIEEVRELLADRGWPFRVSMTWDYINCDLEHVSKASGLRRFFEATGYNPARSVGLGDTTSDCPLAEACGWFGAPANADDALKQKATVVSAYEETAGAIDLLEQAGVLAPATSATTNSVATNR